MTFPNVELLSLGKEKIAKSNLPFLVQALPAVVCQDGKPGHSHRCQPSPSCQERQGVEVDSERQQALDCALQNCHPLQS